MFTYFVLSPGRYWLFSGTGTGAVFCGLQLERGGLITFLCGRYTHSARPAHIFEVANDSGVFGSLRFLFVCFLLVASLFVFCF